MDPIDELEKARLLQPGDYLAILDLPPTTDNFTVIQKTYKKLAKKYHPDKNQDNIESAAENFRTIKKAYDKLRDIFLINGEVPDYRGIKRVADQVSYIAGACLNAEEFLNISCSLLRIIPNSIYMLLGSEKKLQIKKLDVSHNQIACLSGKIFNQFPNLEILVANDCLIESIGKEALDHGNIREIYVDGNEYELFSDDVYVKLREKGVIKTRINS